MGAKQLKQLPVFPDVRGSLLPKFMACPFLHVFTFFEVFGKYCSSILYFVMTFTCYDSNISLRYKRIADRRAAAVVKLAVS